VRAKIPEGGRVRGRIATTPQPVRKLVFITQQVDPRHPALAATVPKIRALAELVDDVVVLADGAVPGVLPENCRVRTFRAGHKALRGARFEAALVRELPGLRDGAVVAHMCPIYAVLAAPFVRPLGVPLVLWFTHWRRSRLLEAAERAATAIVSVDERSFPLPSRKLRAIGHGIDLDEFPCSPPRAGTGTRLLALGRYSTAKGLDVVVAAVPLAGDDVELRVHGPALSEEERAHRGELEQVVAELGLEERVTIGDSVPRNELPALFAEHDALVNNMRAGAPDKVVYEASAACLPVLASNPIFDELLGAEQRFTRWDPGSLADRITALAAMTSTERATLGQTLHARVAERHSVRSWARGVLEAAGIS
jgi:glycosyltransferase involved in cell wall biosynthesis